MQASQTKVSADDRTAIEYAALTLHAIADYAETHPDFAAHLERIKVPGGEPVRKFAREIGLTATRHPTPWKLDDRRRAAEAA